MADMTATAVLFPTARTGTPTLAGKALELFKSTVQTLQEATRKCKLFYVTTDSGDAAGVEIVSGLDHVTSATAAKISDGVFRAIVALPKSTAPGTAVITGLAASTIYMIKIYGR